MKFALFEKAACPRRIVHGWIEEVGTAPHFRAYGAAGSILAEKRWLACSGDALFRWLLNWIDDHLGGNHLVAAGHRIVHGGDRYGAPCLLTETIVEDLNDLASLAPLHQPHNLAAVAAVSAIRPKLPQFACFDTAFHRTLGPTVRRFGLPHQWEQKGARRYGFHGLSYEFVSGRLKELVPQYAGGRIIVGHLGNGASLCALRDGISVDTTMGFSTLDGLVMGTRCGAMDPGLILYLLRHGVDISGLEKLLYQQSGLLGVSGVSSDMRVLLASTDDRAKAAVDLFVFRVARECAALAMTLGGLDGLVFTAGIGEKSPEIRRLVGEKLSWLGLSLDLEANTSNALEISAPSSSIKSWVIPTDEESIVARHVWALMN